MVLWKALIFIHLYSVLVVLKVQQLVLNHWGQVTHVCVSKLTINGWDNGLLPGHHLAIIWTNVGILLNWTLRTNFSEILSEIHTFSFKKIPSGQWQQFCLCLNVLNVPYMPHTSILFIIWLSYINVFEFSYKWDLIYCLGGFFNIRWLLNSLQSPL